MTARCALQPNFVHAYGHYTMRGFWFWMNLSSGNFVYFCTTDVSAVQGHPRSLILVPMDSAYATSYQSAKVTSVLSCTISEICQLLCAPDPHGLHLFSTVILGVFPLHQIAHVGVSQRISPKLCGREIIFGTVPVPEVRHRRTDRQSDVILWQYRAVHSISREKEIIISWIRIHDNIGLHIIMWIK